VTWREATAIYPVGVGIAERNILANPDFKEWTDSLLTYWNLSMEEGTSVTLEKITEEPYHARLTAMSPPQYKRESSLSASLWQQLPVAPSVGWNVAAVLMPVFWYGAFYQNLGLGKDPLTEARTHVRICLNDTWLWAGLFSYEHYEDNWFYAAIYAEWGVPGSKCLWENRNDPTKPWPTDPYFFQITQNSEEASFSVLNLHHPEMSAYARIHPIAGGPVSVNKLAIKVHTEYWLWQDTDRVAKLQLLLDHAWALPLS
jgi:hypothetical protein